MKFNFGFGKDPEVVGLEKEIAKTVQHSDSKKEENLKKGEGTRFSNPHGENNYNLPDHEDDERLRNNSHSSLYAKGFTPIEDVADETDIAIEDFENQDLTPGLRMRKSKEEYDDQIEFTRVALNKLNATEFNTLFSFLKSLDENNNRADYLGSIDNQGEFIAPSRSMSKDITDLIKKVNDNGRKVVRSLENIHDDEDDLVDTKESTVSADSIKFKSPQDPKKHTLKKVR